MKLTEHCLDCKYYMWDSCLHINRFFCNNSELWTPIGMGKYDVSCFKLPKNVERLIEDDVYTNEEIFNFIRFKWYPYDDVSEGNCIWL